MRNAAAFTIILLITEFFSAASHAKAGIVASWHFEEGQPGGVASGPVPDSSGNGLNGTPYGAPIYVSDRGSVPGSTLGLNFSSSRIAVPDSALLQLTHSLTLDAYIRIDGAPVSPCCAMGQIIFRGDDRAGFDPYELFISPSGQLVFAITNASNQSAVLSSPYILPTGVFLRVTGSLDDATGMQRLFVNGTMIASQSTSIRPFGQLSATANPGVGIGSTQSATIPEQFTGVIDEVNIRDDATFGIVGVPSINTGGVVPIYSTISTIQPGEWVSIFGSNLASGSATWNGDFPTSLGGTSVTINGKAAFLWLTSPGQINLQAPDDTASGTVPVVVTTASGSATATVVLSSFAPSFSLLDTTHVAGIILRPNGTGSSGGGTYDVIGPPGSSLGYPTVAAKAGDIVELFGVGFGPTNPPVSAGAVFSSTAPATSTVQLLIGGKTVNPSFAGLSAAGLYQINVTVPEGLGTGDVSLVGTVGGVQTPTVVISLQ